MSYEPEDNDIFSNSKSLKKSNSTCCKKFFFARMFSFLKHSKKIFPSAIILLVSIVLSAVGLVFIWLDKTLSSVNYVKEDACVNVTPELQNNENKDGFLKDFKILNILILGIDGHNENEKGRSDSIILTSIDLRHQKIKISSFMRDLFVEIPNYSQDKLNHAFVYGGAPLVVQTIEKNFKIAIDKYIYCNFEDFKDIINAFGGIDMNLTAEEAAYINKWSRYDRYLEVSDGVKHLLAPHALCHARNRSTAGSDFDRTKRQRDVVKTCFSKLRESNVITIADIISKGGPKITTNFKKNEIIRLLPNMTKFLKFEVQEYSVPEQNDYINTTKKGMCVLKIKKMDESCYKLANFIYEDVKSRKDN